MCERISSSVELAGAAHSTELPYLYRHDVASTAAHFRPEDAKLSEAMIRYWGAFIRRGNPNVPGGAAWPRYNETLALLELKPGEASAPISEQKFQEQHKCEFWDGLRGATVYGQVPAVDASGTTPH